MSDWMREIELQHIYGFTPTEAKIYASKESGLSITDIADNNRISMQTVSNILHKARQKMDKGDRTMEIVILRIPFNTPNYTLHTNAIEVLTNFVANALNLKIIEKNNTIKIKGLDMKKPGDVSWMKANVFRYVDLLGTRNQQEVIERVQRILNQYRQCDGYEDKLGYSLLFHYLDSWYVKYDVYEDGE